MGLGAQSQGLVGKREQGWGLAELADLQAVAFPWSSPLPPILQSPSFFRLLAVVYWGANSGAAGGANRQGNGAKAMGDLEVRVHPGRLGRLACGSPGNGSWLQP